MSASNASDAAVRPGKKRDRPSDPAPPAVPRSALGFAPQIADELGLDAATRELSVEVFAQLQQRGVKPLPSLSGKGAIPSDDVWMACAVMLAHAEAAGGEAGALLNCVDSATALRLPRTLKATGVDVGTFVEHMFIAIDVLDKPLALRDRIWLLRSQVRLFYVPFHFVRILLTI